MTKKILDSAGTDSDLDEDLRRWIDSLGEFENQLGVVVELSKSDPGKAADLIGAMKKFVMDSFPPSSVEGDQYLVKIALAEGEMNMADEYIETISAISQDMFVKINMLLRLADRFIDGLRLDIAEQVLLEAQKLLPRDSNNGLVILEGFIGDDVGATARQIQIRIDQIGEMMRDSKDFQMM